GLSRLEMREPERGQCAVGPRKVSERKDDAEQSPPNQLQGIPMLDEIGIVSHERARRTQVDDPARRWSLLAQMVDVRHHIVSQLALESARPFQVEVVQMLTDRCDGLFGDF